MTLIIAMRESETSLLIAADGLERSSNQVYSKTKRPKLHRKAPDIGVAWAGSGNATVADWFSDRLKAKMPKSWQEPKSWQQMKGKNALIPVIVGNLNGDRREIVKLSGADWKDDFGVTVVLAGWLNGQVGIWEIDTVGIPTPCIEQGFCAVGGVAQCAELIYKALHDSPQAPLEKLKTIFNVIIEGIPSIGYPVDIWRITPDGVTALEGRDDQGK